MRNENLKKTLENAFPETPVLFHQRLVQAAESARQTKRASRSRLAARLALIGALMLVMGGAAVAAMNHYGVFNFDPGWEDAYYFTLPEARDLIRYDLCQASTGNILWQVKEAAYDGRVLRLLYSARDLTATQPFPAEDDAWEHYAAMASREGVFLKCDGNGEIFVNDTGVNLQSVDMRVGQENGEIEFWVDCRMDYFDPEQGAYGSIQPEGIISVSMPFSFQENFQGSEAPEALSFRMDVGNAASRYALQLPDPVTLENGAVLTFTDLHFSPATVFMDFTLTTAPGRAEGLPDKDQDPEAYFNALEKLEEYRALWRCHLENARGEQLGHAKDGFTGDRLNPDGSLTLTRHYECTPSDQYTRTIYLCLDSWKIPIPMIYQNAE